MNIKLADAVIAATALLNNFKLATRNVEDFKAIEGLEIINPFLTLENLPDTQCEEETSR